LVPSGVIAHLERWARAKKRGRALLLRSLRKSVDFCMKHRPSSHSSARLSASKLQKNQASPCSP
jgi:hypothetical protein